MNPDASARMNALLRIMSGSGWLAMLMALAGCGKSQAIRQWTIYRRRLRRPELKLWPTEPAPEDNNKHLSARLNRLLKKSAMTICRRLKPAPDKLNKRLNGTTEVVP